MISTNQFKSGMAIVLDGQLYQIIDYQHVKPGKGAAFCRVRLRNMTNQKVIERTFRSEEKVQDAFIETKILQYQYHEGDIYNFMDQETYEPMAINQETLGDAINYLIDNMPIKAMMYDHKIIGIEAPTFVELRVESSEPGMKGDTVKQGTKPAKLQTGYIIQVPIFINEGDIIKVDTRTGTYVERVQS